MSQEYLGMSSGWEVSRSEICLSHICARWGHGARGWQVRPGELPYLLGEHLSLSRCISPCHMCTLHRKGEMSSLRGADLSTPHLPHLLTSAYARLGQPGHLGHSVPREEHKTSRWSVHPSGPWRKKIAATLAFHDNQPGASRPPHPWAPVPPTGM